MKGKFHNCDDINRQFPSFSLPLCQNESPCKIIHSFEAFCTRTRFETHAQAKWVCTSRSFFFRYFKTGNILHNYADVLAILMRLRQLCCHPKLCAGALALSSTESKCCKWFKWILPLRTVTEIKVKRLRPKVCLNIKLHLKWSKPEHDLLR